MTYKWITLDAQSCTHRRCDIFSLYVVLAHLLFTISYQTKSRFTIKLLTHRFEETLKAFKSQIFNIKSYRQCIDRLTKKLPYTLITVKTLAVSTMMKSNRCVLRITQSSNFAYCTTLLPKMRKMLRSFVLCLLIWNTVLSLFERTFTLNFIIKDCVKIMYIFSYEHQFIKNIECDRDFFKMK